jgi:hypothetical protein
MLALLLLVCILPLEAHGGRGDGYPHHAYGGPHYPPPHRYHSSHHDHRDAWIPLAVIGGVLGIIALSQMEPAYNRPAPPRRICRDTYNYYDEYGNYLYSRYVDRPCND